MSKLIEFLTVSFCKGLFMSKLHAFKVLMECTKNECDIDLINIDLINIDLISDNIAFVSQWVVFGGFIVKVYENEVKKDLL